MGDFQDNLGLSFCVTLHKFLVTGNLKKKNPCISTSVTHAHMQPNSSSDRKDRIRSKGKCFRRCSVTGARMLNGTGIVVFDLWMHNFHGALTLSFFPPVVMDFDNCICIFILLRCLKLTVVDG